MFLGGYSYYSGTEQRHSRAPFIILLARDKELRLLVRKVAMRQVGHFMMGKANIDGRWIGVSGMFGNDGLPIDSDKVSDLAWESATPVPSELAFNYWHSSGYHRGDLSAEAAIHKWWMTAEIA